MTMTRITQIRDYTSPLQAAGRTDGEDTFNVSGSAFALRAEAAFAPQDGLPYGAFLPIVRRFYTRVIDKYPQIVSLVEDATALP